MKLQIDSASAGLPMTTSPILIWNGCSFQTNTRMLACRSSRTTSTFTFSWTNLAFELFAAAQFVCNCQNRQNLYQCNHDISDHTFSINCRGNLVLNAPSPIDRKYCPCNIFCIFRCQKRNRISNVIRTTNVPQRNSFCIVRTISFP